MGMVEQGGLGGAAQGAALGAAAGSVVPGLGTGLGAAIGGGVGLLGGVMGGKGAKKSAQAAQQAARARQIEVGKYSAYQQGLADRVRSAIDNPAEMAALSSAMGAAERDLGRQEQMIQALDPALKEAAGQALSLLQGKDAAALAPLRAERARQRQTLLNTLRAQLGPGAENSSAGQQALNRFDAETSNTLASTQQSSLSQLFGIADRGTQYSLGQGINTLQNAAGARAGRTLQGIGMESDLMRGAWNARTGVAGSEFAGKSMQGQFQQQAGGQLIGALSGLASSAFGGAASGAAGAAGGAAAGMAANSGANMLASGQMNNYDLPKLP